VGLVRWALYKGREYYVVWEGTTRRGPAYKLSFKDGTKQFWADATAVKVTKSYPRPQTIRSLREYVQTRREGLGYQDYQEAIEWAEDLDEFREVRRLESLGYRGWVDEQRRS